MVGYGKEPYILTDVKMPFIGEPNRKIVYRMYADDPGMVYYTITPKPKEPKPVTVPETVPSMDEAFEMRLQYGILAGIGAGALAADNVTGVGTLDNGAMLYLMSLIAEYFSKACSCY